MMGVGKSTIGKKLAYHLDHDFIDIDYLIEKKEGCSIAVIFKNKGESYFRTLEKKITLRELKKNNAVISLGGGAFLEKTIRRAVKDTSVSFWLDVSTNILVKRLQKTDKRPLLLKKNFESSQHIKTTAGNANNNSSLKSVTNCEQQQKNFENVVSRLKNMNRVYFTDQNYQGEKELNIKMKSSDIE